MNKEEKVIELKDRFLSDIKEPINLKFSGYGQQISATHKGDDEYAVTFFFGQEYDEVLEQVVFTVTKMVLTSDPTGNIELTSEYLNTDEIELMESFAMELYDDCSNFK